VKPRPERPRLSGGRTGSRPGSVIQWPAFHPVRSRRWRMSVPHAPRPTASQRPVWWRTPAGPRSWPAARVAMLSEVLHAARDRHLWGRGLGSRSRGLGAAATAGRKPLKRALGWDFREGAMEYFYDGCHPSSRGCACEEPKIGGRYRQQGVAEARLLRRGSARRRRLVPEGSFNRQPPGRVPEEGGAWPQPHPAGRAVIRNMAASLTGALELN